jgi:phosphorylcholine metabolism protein LicD
MIHGLEHFRIRFAQYADNFILVGGVAAYLQLEEAGASRVRPTKDLDIVLMMKPTDEFLKAFRDYVADGEYEIQKGDNGQATFYRFQKPKKNEFPVMLELFATAEKSFELFDSQHIIPITTPKGAESLSAILLDEEYFELIQIHAVLKNGINIIDEKALIPFKAKAYLEIKERKEDSKNWKKHRADIINLAVAFLTDDSKVELKGKVHTHFEQFIEQLRGEITPDIVLGACDQKITPDEIMRLLENTFLKK